MGKPKFQLKKRPLPQVSYDDISLDDDDNLMSADEFMIEDNEVGKVGRKASADTPAEAKEEVSAVLQGFMDRRKAEQERFELVTDSEYWVAVCFPTRALKEEFLSELEMLKDGDKYIDGMQLADAIGLKLKSPIPRIYATRMEESWGEFTMD